MLLDGIFLKRFVRSSLSFLESIIISTSVVLSTSTDFVIFETNKTYSCNTDGQQNTSKKAPSIKVASASRICKKQNILYHLKFTIISIEFMRGTNRLHEYY